MTIKVEPDPQPQNVRSLNYNLRECVPAESSSARKIGIRLTFAQRKRWAPADIQAPLVPPLEPSYQWLRSQETQADNQAS